MIADSGESMTGLPLELHIQSPSSGLFSCFALQLGFAPMAPLQDPGADGLITFGVALWSSLPIALPIRKLEVGHNERKPACLLNCPLWVMFHLCCILLQWACFLGSWALAGSHPTILLLLLHTMIPVQFGVQCAVRPSQQADHITDDAICLCICYDT